MSRTQIKIVVISALALLLIGTIFALRQTKSVPISSETATMSPSPTSTEPASVSPTAIPTPSTPATSEPAAVAQASIVEPIADFKSRITKKSFGTKVSPDNSPVQPEKFSGYHTGVDVEYTDKPGQDIQVKVISSGKVIVSRTASGYGGVVAIQHTLDGKEVVAVYGHLDPASMVKNGATVKAGDSIGILGEGGTPETDGERKHLHLSIVKGSTANIKGYVQTQSELSGWYDPLSFY